MSASTIWRNAGITLSKEPGKLIPSRRGQDSQVAVCGSHSPGIRYPRAAGVSELMAQTFNAQRPTLNVEYSALVGEPSGERRLPACSLPATSYASDLRGTYEGFGKLP